MFNKYIFNFKEKATPWEGGIRTAAFVWSKLLTKKNPLSSHLMHISDWLPTLYQAAGKYSNYCKYYKIYFYYI